jgi:hypothetical protein
MSIYRPTQRITIIKTAFIVLGRYILIYCYIYGTLGEPVTLIPVTLHFLDSRLGWWE